MNAFACAAMGYLIGNLNPAYLLSKIKGFDIRQRGSGNAGATNLHRWFDSGAQLEDIFGAAEF